jgi:RNA polymerase sigma factor (sigma-70 family)
MATATPRAVADLIHRLASRHASADTPDEELLRRFATTGDANAFELLLWRHERMVMGVCRRVLRDVHDAEDAFQATFLVLARKARSIAARRAVTTWLYAVAYRVALNALKERTRRLARVGPLPDETELVTPNQPGQPDIGGLLDEAVNSLPARYRGPVLLCLLEGRSHAEAARILGCAAGTVASRLARAKARLRAWLARHGVRAPAAALAAGLGAAGAPSASARAIVSVTLQATKAVLAGGTGQAAVSPRVLSLAQGVLGAMFRTRLLQTLAVVFLTVVVWGAGWFLSARDVPAAEPPAAPQARGPGKAEPPEKKTERTDAFGDPLPAGAVARLGSLRLYHDSQVQRVVLSPDGKWVVGWDQTGNRLWDAQTGKESPLPPDLLDVWDAKTKTMRRTTMLATADRLVAVKKEKDRIILWDVAAAKEIAKLPLEDGASEEFELSRDGKTLVCSSSGLKRDARHKLVFIDVARATVRDSVDLAEGKSVCPSEIGLLSRGLTFSADGSTLAVHYWANWVDGNWVNANWVDVWDAKTNTVRYSCGGGEQVSLSPNGSMLAGASHGEKKVHLWDVRAKKELEPLPLDPTLDPSRSKFATGLAHAVAFSPDGKFLAVTCEAEVVLYDLATRKVVQRLKGTGPSLPGLVFSQDGKRLAAGDDRAVALWDLKTGEPCHDLGHGYGIRAVAFSPDGRTIVTGADYSDNVVRSWDALTGKNKGRWRGHKDGIEAIAYAPDGLLVASSSDDGTVRLWDAATGKEIGCLDARDGAVKAIAFSSDGKTLASGGERKVVHLWDVSTRKEVRTFDNPGGRTVCLAFSPDGQTLATRGTAEDRVRIWDVAAGTQRREFGGLSAGNDRLLALGRPSLSFSPDNRTLAVNCDDGTVHLLDVTTGKELRVLGESQRAPAAGGGGAPGGEPPGCPCLGVTFAPDGRSLAASYDANYKPDYNLWVRVWEVASSRERTRFKGHAGFVTVSAYSPDGTLLVTGGTDRTALVWDVFGLRTSDQKKADFTREDVDRFWADLADADAGKAFGVMKVLRANSTPAVSLLKERLRPVAASDPKKIARLIADLDQEDFTARESATKQLSELGELAEPALRAALNDKPSAEKRRRIDDLLKRLDPSNFPEVLRGVRAVEVLESLGTPEARQVLQTLAEGAAEARLTREAKAALERRKK